MNREESIAYQVDRYLNQEMLPEEQLRFGEQVQSDSELQGALEEERALRALWVEGALASWKQEAVKQHQRRQLRGWTRMIGGVVFLLVLSIVLWPHTKDETEGKASEPLPVLTEPLPEEEGLLKPEEPTQYQPKPGNQETSLNPEVRVPATEQELNQILAEPTGKQEETVLEPVAVETEPSVTEPNIEPENAPQNPKPTDPCAGVKIQVKFDVKHPCERQDNGSVEILGFSGGEAPYTWFIDEEQITGDTRAYLAKGRYEVRAKDRNGCASEVPQIVELVEQFCFQPDPGFNPDYETWKVELPWEEEVSVKIVNRAGVLVKATEFYERFEWDGLSDAGEQLPIGIYLYEFSSTGKKPLRGTLNLIR